MAALHNQRSNMRLVSVLKPLSTIGRTDIRWLEDKYKCRISALWKWTLDNGCVVVVVVVVVAVIIRISRWGDVLRLVRFISTKRKFVPRSPLTWQMRRWNHSIRGGNLAEERNCIINIKTQCQSVPKLGLSKNQFCLRRIQTGFRRWRSRFRWEKRCLVRCIGVEEKNKRTIRLSNAPTKPRC